MMIEAAQTPQLTEVLTTIQWRGWLNITINVIGAIGVLVSIFVSLNNKGRITELKVRVNGRMEELMNKSIQLAEAKGKLMGREEQTREREQAGIVDSVVGVMAVEGTVTTNSDATTSTNLTPLNKGIPNVRQ